MSIIDSNLEWADEDKAMQQIAEAAHQGIDAWLADELEDQWLDAYMEDVLSGGGLDI